MKKLNVLLLSFAMCISLFAHAANPSITCNKSITPFETHKNQIISQVKIAKDYFMHSSDPAAGNTFEERTGNFSKAINKTFEAFIERRTNEYKQVVCHYRGVDWNQPGKSSWRTMKCEPGFYFTETGRNYTTNGDMKKGPNWTNNSVSWQTGGHGRSDTFVESDAMYHQGYISSTVIGELNIARNELNAIGIPTELPPLK